MKILLKCVFLCKNNIDRQEPIHIIMFIRELYFIYSKNNVFRALSISVDVSYRNIYFVKVYLRLSSSYML